MAGTQRRHLSRRERRSQFTFRNILLNLIFITFLVFINKLGMPGNLFFYAILAIMAAQSSEGALKALALSTLVTTISPVFVSLSAVCAVGRMGILFLVAWRLIYDLRRCDTNVLRRSYFIAFSAFCGVTAILSLVSNYFLVVSLLKLLSFAVGAFAIIVGAEAVKVARSDLTCWVYSIICFICLLGMISYVAGIGYAFEKDVFGRAATFFRGPFNHSQTLGAIAGLMLVYVTMIWLFSPYPYKLLTLVICASLLVMLYLTGSRTGLLTGLLGAGVTVICGMLSMRKSDRRVRLNVRKEHLILLMLSCLFVMVFSDFYSGGALSGKARDFIMKHGLGRDELSLDAIFSSRMPLIERSILIFKQAPITGIGFGTSVDPSFAANASLFSAPTEKGFLPTAILEETGVIGTIFFVIFIVSFLTYLYRDRNISGFAIFFTLLVLNLGEMVFFSFGGAGGFCWMMVGAGLALGPRCLTNVADRTRNQRFIK